MSHCAPYVGAITINQIFFFLLMLKVVKALTKLRGTLRTEHTGYDPEPQKHIFQNEGIPKSTK